MAKELFGGSLSVINVGVDHFAKSLDAQKVTTAQVAWRPAADAKLSGLLAKCAASPLHAKIEAANAKVLQALLDGDPVWVGVKPVGEAVPDFDKYTILHSGPPLAWDRMYDVQRNGILGGLMHEKLVKTREEAQALVDAGKVKIRSANDMGVIGPGTGITTYSMPVNVCEDKNTGKQSWCIPFEGRVGLGAWGVYNDEVEANLQILEKVFMPAMDHVLQKKGGVNIKNIIAQGMQMSDETHTRQTAQGLLLVSEVVPWLLRADLDKETIATCVDMLLSSERWFHPLGMAGSFAVIKSAKNIEYSTVVTAISSNGVETGIKVSSLGEQWFTAPSPQLYGQFFSTKWGPEDAMAYMGDSTITEVFGMGAFAAAASPVVLRLRNGGWREAVQQTKELAAICIGTNHNFPIPLLDFSGPPIGIDIRKVVETGITHICHGGIISKQGGQLGAGAARFPMEIYTKAAYAFLEKYGIS